MNERQRRRQAAYLALIDAIRDQALRFLQVAPAMEDRGELEAVSHTRAVSACQPEICSIELLSRNDLIIVRCHTCKRGGSWRDRRQAQT